jgi:hypothetical protein
VSNCAATSLHYQTHVSIVVSLLILCTSYAPCSKHKELASCTVVYVPVIRLLENPQHPSQLGAQSARTLGKGRAGIEKRELRSP